jgi:hypothetical protein
MGDEAASIAVMEHPGPPVSLADARAGLVEAQNGAGKKFSADAAALLGEGFLAVGQHLDECALADFDPEQIGEQPNKPFERGRMGDAQIDRKGRAGLGGTSNPVQAPPGAWP